MEINNYDLCFIQIYPCSILKVISNIVFFQFGCSHHGVISYARAKTFTQPGHAGSSELQRSLYKHQNPPHPRCLPPPAS